MTPDTFRMIVTWSDLRRQWIAEAPDLPIPPAEGQSPEEAITSLRALVAEYLASAQTQGRVVPTPRSYEQYTDVERRAPPGAPAQPSGAVDVSPAEEAPRSSAPWPLPSESHATSSQRLDQLVGAPLEPRPTAVAKSPWDTGWRGLAYGALSVALFVAIFFVGFALYMRPFAVTAIMIVLLALLFALRIVFFSQEEREVWREQRRQDMRERPWWYSSPF